ncbi:MAG: alpha/beta fold hydrolase [Acidimicrobiia bacterium]
MTTKRALGNGLVGTIVAVAAVAFAVPAGAGGPAVRTGPRGDAFYAGKAKAGARNGDVIWVRSVAAPAGARAWKVLYKSQAVSGKPVAVSGIVVAPKKKAPKGGFPVVTWAHGTSGLADPCAPSKEASAAARIPWVDQYLKAGYAVAATDYEGLGTPGLHPYLVGASEGRGVLDAARAARRIPDAHAGNRVVIFGHSQGGHAALFAGQIAPTYAPDLKVVGTAAAAPAAELKLLLGVAASVDSFLGYVTMGARGFGAAYPEAQQALATVMTPKGLKDSDVVETKCSDDVNAAMKQPPDQLIAKNPLDVPPFPKLIDENTPGNVKTRSPMLVVQGTKDPLVIPGTTDSFVQRACGAGDVLVYRKYPGADHGRVMIDSQRDVLAWMHDRFAGTGAGPAPAAGPDVSSCNLQP